MSGTKDLMTRIRNGERFFVGQGYVMELERRGYLRAGPWLPEVILDHPDVVEALHREYVHAGSEVVVACTYYTNPEKLRDVDKEHKTEQIHRVALKLARRVADETQTLMAGDISGTSVYREDDQKTHETCRQIFEEQTRWAVEEGADYIIAETLLYFGEAMLALETIKKHSNGLPVVVTLTVSQGMDQLLDNVNVVDACQKLEAAGADVVGLNCFVGPKSMIPLIRRVRKVCKGPIAALPCYFRTDDQHPTMIQLSSSVTGERAFPDDMDEWLCCRSDIREFTREAIEIGVSYIGLCCGSFSHSLRVMANELEKVTHSDKYKTAMELHVFFGDKDKVKVDTGRFEMKNKTSNKKVDKNEK